MKQYFYPLILLAALAMVSCDQAVSPNHRPIAQSSPVETSLAETSASENRAAENSASPASPLSSDAAAPKVDEFTLDEIQGRGCGMTLWNPDRTSRDRYLFFNGLDENSMEMKIEGEIVKFRRITATGPEFYGQQTNQSFVSEDGNIQVTAAVELGEPGEIESVAIKAGTLRISQAGETIELAVVGDAGC